MAYYKETENLGLRYVDPGSTTDTFRWAATSGSGSGILHLGANFNILDDIDFSNRLDALESVNSKAGCVYTGTFQSSWGDGDDEAVYHNFTINCGMTDPWMIIFFPAYAGQYPGNNDEDIQKGLWWFKNRGTKLSTHFYYGSDAYSGIPINVTASSLNNTRFTIAIGTQGGSVRAPRHVFLCDDKTYFYIVIGQNTDADSELKEVDCDEHDN